MLHKTVSRTRHSSDAVTMVSRNNVIAAEFNLSKRIFELRGRDDVIIKGRMEKKSKRINITTHRVRSTANIILFLNQNEQTVNYEQRCSLVIGSTHTRWIIV